MDSFEQRVENDIAEETLRIKEVYGPLVSKQEIEIKAKLHAVQNNVIFAETVPDMKLLLQLQADILRHLV